MSSREHRLDSSCISSFVPELFQHTLQTLSPSCNVVDFIKAGQPLEIEGEQNVAPILQMHPDPIKSTSQCAVMAAVVVGRRATLVWLLLV